MKTFEVSFAIGAGLAAAFNSTIGLASKKVKDLGKTVKGLEQQQGSIDHFRNMHRDAESARQAFLVARQEANRLEKALAGTEKPTKAMADALERADKKSERLKAAWMKKGQALREARQQMEAAGTTVKGLAAQHDRLAKAIERGKQPQLAYNKVQMAQKANVAHREDLGGKLAVAAGAAVTVAAPVKLAVDFESAMADVKKVVDFKAPDGMQLLQRDILALSTDKGIPMAATGIAQIVASAGQAGLAKDRAGLVTFAEDAAKMGVAFDISADRAGETLASWRSSMDLTRDQSVELADAVNHLSNNMNAKAGDLAEVIKRQGAVGLSAGLSAVQVASLGAALLSSGSGPEIASTAMKNLTGALTKGEAATKSQRDAFEALGLDAVEMAARMQQDAPAAIKEVFAALSQAPKEEQSALVSQLFGEESKGAITPLLTNLGNLDKAFGETSARTKFAASMNTEFAERSKTTANSLTLLKNQTYRLAINIGSTLLPSLNAAAGWLGKVFAFGAGLAERFPKITAAVVGLGAGVATLAVSGLALGYAYTFVKGGLLHAKGLWAVLNVKMAIANAQTIGLAAGQKGLALGTKAVAAAQWAWNTALAANPIGLAVVAAVSLGAAAYQAYKHWDAIKGTFQDIGNWFKGQDWFTSGKGLISSFAHGIVSGAGGLVDAAKSALGKVRELLPFSDAKRGPLSDLTLSGMKIPQTMATGVAAGAPSLERANAAAFKRSSDQALQGLTAQNLKRSNAGAPGRASVEIVFSPTINLTGAGPAATEGVDQALRESESRLRRLVGEMLSGGDRLTYA